MNGWGRMTKIDYSLFFRMKNARIFVLTFMWSFWARCNLEWKRNMQNKKKAKMLCIKDLYFQNVMHCNILHTFIYNIWKIFNPFQLNVCLCGNVFHTYVASSTMIIFYFMKNLLQGSLPHSIQSICIVLENHHEFTIHDMKMSLDKLESIWDQW
jgi:hypothetical protein